MSQDEMTIIILFRLDTILDGKFKPNSFNASWFQGKSFYCFLIQCIATSVDFVSVIVFLKPHLLILSVLYRKHVLICISSKWSKLAINDISSSFSLGFWNYSVNAIYFADVVSPLSFQNRPNADCAAVILDNRSNIFRIEYHKYPTSTSQIWNKGRRKWDVCLLELG